MPCRALSTGRSGSACPPRSTGRARRPRLREASQSTCGARILHTADAPELEPEPALERHAKTGTCAARRIARDVDVRKANNQHTF